ncbi:hypothetical protein HYV80_06180 [Candidatus Woesearchaeota archaeon]|nr:hypothetical protein [Candidatus Woesearchaeota archaeon]
MTNLKNNAIYLLIFILSMSFAFADAENFAEAKKLIDSKIPCAQLAEGQLESIGDYLMEQAHPGEAHEVMDRVMGGEGSESLRLMHIAMAKRLYCNDANAAVDYGMIGYGMMGAYGKGTNYGGMMNMMGGNFGYGMMGNYSYGYWGFLNFLSIILVIGLVILVYMWILKLWKEMSRKQK